jgi:hypothetical protein
MFISLFYYAGGATRRVLKEMKDWQKDPPSG